MSFLVFSLPLLFSTDVNNNHEINNVFLFYDSCYESSSNVFKKVHSSSISCSCEQANFLKVSSRVRFSCNFILRKGKVFGVKSYDELRNRSYGNPICVSSATKRILLKMMFHKLALSEIKFHKPN